MEKHVNYELCKACGGVCCQQNGCIYLPNDFKRLSFNYLLKQLEKGNISITGQPFNGFFGDGWSFILYLRARNVDAPVVDLITSGGPCKLWDKETGCKLKEADRPTVGLTAEPIKIGGPCKNTISQDDMFNWLNYSQVLEELVYYYTNKDVITVVLEQLEEKMQIIEEKHGRNEELKEMECQILEWRKKIMLEKPYYNLEETQKLIRAPKFIIKKR